MIITDSGLHIWRANSPDNPWTPGRTAHLKDPISYENLLVRMNEAGVDRAILVPPSYEGDRSDYSLEAAAKFPERFAVMGRVPIERPEGRAMLDTWKERPGMLGVRLTLHHAWDESWIKDGTADWFWPAAERLNIPVMLNAPSVLKEVGEVAERHPGLRLIIDHMGHHVTKKGENLGDSINRTIELARHSNVYVKLTLLPPCSSEPYPYRDVHAHVRRLIEAFGPRRSFWGTDLSYVLSHSDCTYRQNVTLFTEEMDFLSNEDLEWVMGRGLAECLPWPVAPELASRHAG